jgi:hypothetical protein
MFPSGRAGVGLLVLRLALAMHLCVPGGVALVAAAGDGAEIGIAGIAMRGLLPLLCGALIGLGLLTPLAQIVVIMVELSVLGTQLSADRFATLTDRAGLVPLLHAAVAASLALIGPGAYSVDARIFGRREIVIPARPHPPTAVPPRL